MDEINLWYEFLRAALFSWTIRGLAVGFISQDIIKFILKKSPKGSITCQFLYYQRFRKFIIAKKYLVVFLIKFFMEIRS